jgi:hypothetical protein
MLPSALTNELCEQLVAGGEDAIDALTQIYGARPKDDFVRDAWPILRETWLAYSKESRGEVVRALRQQRGEHGQISNRKAQLEYLRCLRNSKGLREVVLQEFIDFGEVSHHDEDGRNYPSHDFKSRVENPLPPSSGGEVSVSAKNPVFETPQDETRYMQLLSPSSTAKSARSSASGAPTGQSPTCTSRASQGARTMTRSDNSNTR